MMSFCCSPVKSKLIFWLRSLHQKHKIWQKEAPTIFNFIRRRLAAFHFFSLSLFPAVEQAHWTLRSSTCSYVLDSAALPLTCLKACSIHT